MTLSFGVLLFGGLKVSAATRTVDNTSDNSGLTACAAAANDCSLRGAISAATSGDTVDFDAGVFASAQTITLGGTSNPLIINKNLTIIGTDADKLTVSGNNANLVFDVGNFTVGLSGMTVTGGNGTQFLNGSSAPGGGISNTGTLTISNCVITGNQTAPTFSYGGGIYNGGNLTLIGSTVSNNVARFNAFNNGGGISSQTGTLIVTNSTFSGNTVNSTAGGNGGGIHIFSGNFIVTNSTITNNTVNTTVSSAGGIMIGIGTATIRNSIVAANVGNGTYADVFGSFALINGGNNLIGNVGTATGFAQLGDQTGTGSSPLNPQLGALTVANGGKTPTHALLTGSPAANNGNNCVLTNTCTLPVSIGALVFDQRGVSFPRQFGLTNIDIGAVESDLLAPSAANVSISGKVFTPQGAGLTNAFVILTDQDGNSRTARTTSFGYFRFDEVEAGQIYIISVNSKRYQFTPQVLTINEDITELILTANQ